MSDDDEPSDIALVVALLQVGNPVRRKVLPNGDVLELWLQMFNLRITYTLARDVNVSWERAWAYKLERRLEVLKIFEEWSGEGEPPLWNKCEVTGRWREDGTVATEIYQSDEQAVRMVLFCPACRGQHIDRGEWATPQRLHRTHLCEHCGHLWRPHDMATIGVESVPSPEPPP